MFGRRIRLSPHHLQRQATRGELTAASSRIRPSGPSGTASNRHSSDAIGRGCIYTRSSSTFKKGAPSALVSWLLRAVAPIRHLFRVSISPGAVHRHSLCVFCVSPTLEPRRSLSLPASSTSSCSLYAHFPPLHIGYWYNW